MKFAGIVLAVLALPALAMAQEGAPLRLRVKPSGIEEENEHVLRQRRLVERMQRSEYSLRSICTNCGDSWRQNSNAPFSPMNVLGGARENVGTERVITEEVERVIEEPADP